MSDSVLAVKARLGAARYPWRCSQCYVGATFLLKLAAQRHVGKSDSVAQAEATQKEATQSLARRSRLCRTASLAKVDA